MDRWSSLNGKPLPDERPTIQIDSQFRARGFGGCNTFSATAYPAARPALRGRADRPDEEGLPQRRARSSSAPSCSRFRTAVFWGLKDGYLIFAGPGGELKFERGL